MAVATLGMGVWMAKDSEYIETYHAIIGIIVIVAVIAQPITGWLHHRFFVKSGGRTGVSYVHIFWGMGAITLGIINGGFGLQLAGSAQKYVIVYAVLAAVMWVLWMGVSAWAQLRRTKRKTEHVVEPKAVSGDSEDKSREASRSGEAPRDATYA